MRLIFVSILYRVTNTGLLLGRGFPGKGSIPIHGSPTKLASYLARHYSSFNPLYTGHQRNPRVKRTEIYEVQSPIQGHQQGNGQSCPSRNSQSPIHWVPTAPRSFITGAMTRFNPLYTGHQPAPAHIAALLLLVSIPYTRVTNQIPQYIRPFHHFRFNPLYTGHQRGLAVRAAGMIICFNPLYTGHQLFALAFHHQTITQFQSPIHGSPTRRHVRGQFLSSLFQSPIHGSPTVPRLGHVPVAVRVSIPYTRVTNVGQHERIRPA